MNTELVSVQLPTTHKFNSQQYHLMAEAGVFMHIPEPRIELIKGEIIQMSPIGRKHGACVARLDRLIQKLLANELFVWVQNSIRLDDGSEPQPDLALLKLRNDFYAERLPIPEDILLIIEVADSSIEYDRSVKMPLYAEFGIPEAWIIDVNAQILTRYTNPSARGYKISESLDRNDSVLVLGVEIDVNDIFGSGV
jgi:Uma2 family endonuclease